MIGGIDIHLPTRAGEASLEIAVRAIRQSWPRSVFENSATGEWYDGFFSIPFGEVDELFVYRDRDTADAWDTQGAVPGLANTMIHLLADPGSLTVVVDERDAAVESIVSAIQSGLHDDIHCILAELEAA